jgi:hypothetical protein
MPFAGVIRHTLDRRKGGSEMKNANGAATARARRASASEANWQEWISEPVGSGNIPKNGIHHTAPVNGNGHPAHDSIARLAYAIWEKRGRPFGSPEEDWLQAERQFTQRHDFK